MAKRPLLVSASTSRKLYRKARSKKVTKAIVPRYALYKAIGAIKRLTVNLKYGIAYTPGNATTAYNSQVLNMNSGNAILSAGGGQPRFWDQYIAIYNKYIVHSSTVRLMCTSTSNNTSVVFALGGYSHNDSAQTTLQAVLESTNYSTKTFSSLVGGFTLKRKFVCHKIESIKQREYAEEVSFQSVTNTSPAYIPKVEIVMATQDGTTVCPANIGYRGIVVQCITFFEPKMPAAS